MWLTAQLWEVVVMVVVDKLRSSLFGCPEHVSSLLLEMWWFEQCVPTGMTVFIQA